ncbi:MAG: peptidoglycan-binding domain-containing protein [Acidobacteriota bacterium]
MAKKEIITFGPGAAKLAAVNVTSRVGAHGQNRSDDVMLIQSLFQYIGVDSNIRRRLLGNFELPKADGVCGLKTRQAILDFQRKNSHRLLRVDGAIDPADYEGHVIRDVSKPVMTIHLLSFYAFDAAMFQPDSDYIAGLVRIEPRLGPFLN